MTTNQLHRLMLLKQSLDTARREAISIYSEEKDINVGSMWLKAVVYPLGELEKFVRSLNADPKNGSDFSDQK